MTTKGKPPLPAFLRCTAHFHLPKCWQPPSIYCSSQRPVCLWLCTGPTRLILKRSVISVETFVFLLAGADCCLYSCSVPVQIIKAYLTILKANFLGVFFLLPIIRNIRVCKSYLHVSDWVYMCHMYICVMYVYMFPQKSEFVRAPGGVKVIGTEFRSSVWAMSHWVISPARLYVFRTISTLGVWFLFSQ